MIKVSLTLCLQGQIAYVPQQAWIQQTSFRNNITFNKPYNQDLYDRVLDLCELRPDIATLPGGDLVEIGEKVGLGFGSASKQHILLQANGREQMHTRTSNLFILGDY